MNNSLPSINNDNHINSLPSSHRMMTSINDVNHINSLPFSSFGQINNINNVNDNNINSLPFSWSFVPTTLQNNNSSFIPIPSHNDNSSSFRPIIANNNNNSSFRPIIANNRDNSSTPQNNNSSSFRPIHQHVLEKIEMFPELADIYDQGITLLNGIDWSVSIPIDDPRHQGQIVQRGGVKGKEGNQGY